MEAEAWGETAACSAKSSSGSHKRSVSLSSTITCSLTGLFGADQKAWESGEWQNPSWSLPVVLTTAIRLRVRLTLQSFHSVEMTSARVGDTHFLGQR
jgi:hypothetical protein